MIIHAFHIRNAKAKRTLIVSVHIWILSFAQIVVEFIMEIAFVYFFSLFISLACKSLPSESFCSKAGRCTWESNENYSFCRLTNKLDEIPVEFSKCNNLDKNSCLHDISKQDCSWCDYAGFCCSSCSPIRCELISSKDICYNHEDECTWCPSKQACRPQYSPLKCYECDFYSASYCPPGCNCSEKKSSSIIIIVIILSIIFVIIIILQCE